MTNTTKEREELEAMYEEGDCMLDCAICMDKPRPGIGEPFCPDCSAHIRDLGND